MNELTIVQAGENDADLVAIMVYQLLNEIMHGEMLLNDEDIHAAARQLLAEDTPFAAFLAYDTNRKPVAVMTVTEAVALYAKGKFGIITEFYVDPGARSLGVGERMLSHTRQYGKENGWSRIELNAPEGEQGARARAFYAREGFEQIGPNMRLLLK